MRLTAGLLALLLLAPATVIAQGFSAQIMPPRFEDRAQPGGVFRDVIEVANISPVVSRMKVSTADWVLDEKGTAQFSSALAPGSCRPWTALEATEIEVPANGRRRFRFEVRVPAGAPDGQCRFAIMFEGEPTPVPGMVLPVAGRIGIIVYLDIGKGAARLQLAGSGVTELNGVDVPYLRVRNDGNAHGRLDGFVDGVDAEGKRWTLAPTSAPVMPGLERDIALFPIVNEGEPIRISFPIQLKGRLDWRTQRLDIDVAAGR